jgi:hypothetical protein
MTFRPRIIHGGGSGESHMLPRGIVDRAGEMNWPRCIPCNRSVDAYGIGEHVPGRYIEIWVRCDGIAGVYGGTHVRSYRSGIRIDLVKFPHAWTENTRSDTLRRIALKPGVFSKWQAVLRNPDLVVPR